jgi:hypothetical protein
VKVEVVTVAGSNCRSKVAVSDVVMATPVAPFAGVVELTAGATVTGTATPPPPPPPHETRNVSRMHKPEKMIDLFMAPPHLIFILLNRVDIRFQVYHAPDKFKAG